jgi:hypothetical protein
MRAMTSWIVAAFGLLFAGVLLDTARAAPHRGLRRTLAPYVEPFLPGSRIQAAVLLQKADCSGNVRMLDLLNQPDVRDRVRLAVLWHVGPPSDTLAIRALLPAWTRSVPLESAPAAAIGELKQLGHASTPLLVVLDQEGRVRLTTQSPRSPREFAGLRRIIEGLTFIEEL